MEYIVIFFKAQGRKENIVYFTTNEDNNSLRQDSEIVKIHKNIPTVVQ